MIALSVVVPIRDEANVVEELVRRCTAAAATQGTFELLLVDDASRDDTPRILKSLESESVQHVRLEENVGQFASTQAGLALARGALVAVLDGDLQDPPELLVELCDALSRSRADVAFAVKQRRQERGLHRVGLAAYHSLSRLGGSRAPPFGAGSFCVMQPVWAARAASVHVRTANLAAVLAALGAQGVTVPYDKARRYDDASRVGSLGLMREAVVSLTLTGAAPRLLTLLAAASGGAGGLALRRHPLLGVTGLALAAGLSVSARAAERWARRGLAQSRSA